MSAPLDQLADLPALVRRLEARARARDAPASDGDLRQPILRIGLRFGSLPLLVLHQQSRSGVFTHLGSRDPVGSRVQGAPYVANEREQVVSIRENQFAVCFHGE